MDEPRKRKKLTEEQLLKRGAKLKALFEAAVAKRAAMSPEEREAYDAAMDLDDSCLGAAPLEEQDYLDDD